MIQREWKDVEIITYTEEPDAYGQSKRTIYSTKTCEMVVKNYVTTNVSDIRYANVELIGLTKDFTIEDKNDIRIDNCLYNVLYVKPTSRLNQVFMRKAYEDRN